MQHDSGLLVISLDFELLWGVFDKVNWKQKVEYFLNTRKVLPKVLNLFEQYGIGCTWATVGMLFNSDWDEWNNNFPGILPTYENGGLSAYTYGKNFQTKETEKLCFAPDLVRKILEYPGQEIGSHTYSHYYCKEPGQNSDSFKADLVKAKEMADNFNIRLNSLVFPRNQINEEYLLVCRELDIQNVRTNPNIWYWEETQKDTLAQKLFRTGDAYFGLYDKPYETEAINMFGDITMQPASRLLRPYSGKKLLDNLKLTRIINEMEYAAKNNLIYHLWWHPHNFGTDPSKGLEELKIILAGYKKIQNKFGFQSVNMNQIGKYFRE